MRVAIYARVSTDDKGQTPETQLIPLREFVAANGWTIAGEFVDTVSAADLRRRKAWSDLLEAAHRRQVDLILCWKLDRCFRSTLHAAETLEKLRSWGIGLRSYTEAWADSTSPAGELMFTIAVAFAAFERDLIRGRVRAGMERARREGRHLGRPSAMHRTGFAWEWAQLRPQVLAGTMSRRAAARALGISTSALRRLLATAAEEGPSVLPSGPERDSEAVGTG